MDPLQHTLVGGGPLWYGEANFGTMLFQQFTTVVVLDEQMRQDDDILGAKALHTFLQCIRQHGITVQEIFEQLNSRAINNKQQDIPYHVLILLTRHLLVCDIP